MSRTKVVNINQIKLTTFGELVYCKLTTSEVYCSYKLTTGLQKEVNTLTDMKRVTISFSDDAVRAIDAIRRNAGEKISFSEAVRRLILAGKSAIDDNHE